MRTHPHPLAWITITALLTNLVGAALTPLTVAAAPPLVSERAGKERDATWYEDLTADTTAPASASKAGNKTAAGVGALRPVASMFGDDDPESSTSIYFVSPWMVSEFSSPEGTELLQESDLGACPDASQIAMSLIPPPDPVSRGNTTGEVFTTTITNNSTITIPEVSLIITPSVGFYYLGDSASVTSSAEGVLTTTDTGTGSPGATSTITLTGTVTDTMLQSAETVTFTFKLATDADAESGQRLEVALQSGSDQAECESTGENVETVRGNLVVSKRPAVQDGTYADDVSWSVTLRNTGLGDIYNAVFTDTAGVGLTGLTIDPPPDPITLTPEASQVYTVSATIGECENLTNTVEAAWSIGNADGTGTADNPVRDRVDIVYLVQDPDVSVEMSSLESVDYCQSMDQTVAVTVTNGGGGARDLRLDISTDVNVAPEDGDWSLSGSQLEYTAGTPSGAIASGETVTFALRVTQTAACDTGQAHLELTPRYDDPCGLLEGATGAGDSSTVSLGGDPPTLNLAKEGPRVVHAGQTFAYTVTASGANQENISVGGVNVTDTLPSILDIVDVRARAGTTETTGNDVMWHLPLDGSGDYQEELFIDVRVPGAGEGVCKAGESISNTAEAVADVCSECAPDMPYVRVGPTYVEDFLGAGNVFTKTGPSLIEPCAEDGPQTIVTELSISDGITWTDSVYVDRLGGDGAFATPLEVISDAVSAPRVIIDEVDRTDDVTITLGPPLSIDFSAIGTYSESVEIGLEYGVRADGSVLGSSVERQRFLFSEFTLGGDPGTACNGGSTGYVGAEMTVRRGDLDVSVTPSQIRTCEENTIEVTVSGGTEGTTTDNVVVTFTAESADVFTPTNYTLGGAFSGESPNVEKVGEVVTFTFPVTLELDSPGTISFPLYREDGVSGSVSAHLSYQDECDQVRSATGTGGTTTGHADVKVSLEPTTLRSCQENPVTITVSGAGADTTTDNVVVAFTAQTGDVFTETDYALGGGFAGASPVVTKSGSVITFTFPATMEMDSDGTIAFPLYRPCGVSGDLTAELSYQNRCGTTRTNTGTGGSSTTASDVTLFATPDSYVVNEKTARWRFYVSNQGDQTASEVAIANTLPSGYAFDSYAISSDNVLTSAITHDTAGGLVEFTIPSTAGLDPGDRVRFDVTSTVASCQSPAAVNIALSQTCGQVAGSCEGQQEDQVVFYKGRTSLLSSNDQTANLQLCGEGTVALTVKNTSGASHEYDFVITDELENATYVAGSAKVTVRDDDNHVVTGKTSGIQLQDVSFTPTVKVIGSSEILTWAVDSFASGTPQYDVLADRDASEVIRVIFDIGSDCSSRQARVWSSVEARDVCDEVLTTQEAAQTLTVDEPELTINSRGRNVTTGSDLLDATNASAGDTVAWRVDVSNVGTQDAFYLFVTDTVPTNFRVTETSPPTTTQSGRELGWELDGGVALAQGASTSFYITGTVESITCSLSSSNVAEADYGCTADSGCLTTDVSGAAYLRTVPELTVSPMESKLSNCGGLITATLRHDGPPASNVVLTDTLPEGFVYETTVFSTTPPDGMPAGTATPVWTWNELTADTTIVFRVRNDESSGACSAFADPVSNGMEVAYDDTCSETGPYSDTRGETMPVGTPDLVVTKRPPKQVASEGEVVTWTVHVTNTATGYAPAQNVVITDTLGSGFSSPDASEGIYGGGSSIPGVAGNTITWTPGITLAAGDSWAAVVTATVNGTGEHANTIAAEGFCGSGCSYAGPVSDSVHVTVLDSFKKSPDWQVGTIGQKMVFTITGSLPDEHALYENLTLTDTLETGLGYLSSTLVYTPDGPSGSEVISHTPTITPGEVTADSAEDVIVWQLGDVSGTVQFTSIVTAVVENISSNDDGMMRTNSVELAYSDDGSFYGFDDQVEMGILEPSVTIDKDSAPPSGSYVGAGDLITYFLTITNDGQATAYDIVVSDTLPSGVGYVTSTVGSASPSDIGFEDEPLVGATGTLSWQVDTLWGTQENAGQPGRAVITVTGRVTDTIGAARTLENRASITAYDAWAGEGGLYADQERTYQGEADGVAHRTVNAGIAKRVDFGPPPEPTLGSLVTYTLVVPDQPISATLYDVVVTDTVPLSVAVEKVVMSGDGVSSDANGVVTASFASIPAETRAYVTITTRIMDELGAEEGDILSNAAQMVHSTASVTDSNQVNTVMGEPTVVVDKSVEPGNGPFDGTDLLTYTVRLTNTGSSPAYSLVITDTVPEGISVTAQYGGDGRSGPAVGPGLMTWTLDYLSHTAGANVEVLTYTARISRALSGGTELRNEIDVLYHSLTETVPGVRSYASQSDARLTTASPVVEKNSEPLTLRVGDVVTYYAVFTIPAGTVGMGGRSYVEDTLPEGVWYVPGSDSLDWTPSGVDPITYTARTTSTVGSSEVVTWAFGTPITSVQDAPTVVTLTFQAQATGVDADGDDLEPWAIYGDVGTATNSLRLVQQGDLELTDAVDNEVEQPDLLIEKTSIPSSGSFVAQGETLTYTLVITNVGAATAYDVVVTDTLPGDVDYVRTISAPHQSTSAITPTEVEGGIAYALDALGPGTMAITVVARVTDSVSADLMLVNEASIPYYDSQPGQGPQEGLTPTQRTYSSEVDSAEHRTAQAGLAKTVEFGPPPTATLGSLVTYTLTVPDSPISATMYSVVVTDTVHPSMTVKAVDTAGGTGAQEGISGQVVTATFAEVSSYTQAYVTVTARISDGLGAFDGHVIPNAAEMIYDGASVTESNQVNTVVGEPAVTVHKSVEPASGPFDGTDLLTYTVRLTNTGSSPAYSLVITDTVPEGISVTAQYGGDGRSGPVVGPEAMTWRVDSLSNVVGENVKVLTYTARISQALSDAPLTNGVELLYHSLTDTTPGVRLYDDAASAEVSTVSPTLSKSSDPFELRVGDVVTYHAVFTIPAGTVGMGGTSYVEDTLPEGVWYMPGSESLAWTPSGVDPITYTARTTSTVDSSEVVRWTFGTPITSLQDARTVVTLTFQAQATGESPSGSRWLNPSLSEDVENRVELFQRGTYIGEDAVTNEIVQPELSIAKTATPLDGALVGAGDLISYALTINNNGHATAYDVAVTDALPQGVEYVRTDTALNPVTAAITPTESDGGVTYEVDQVAVGTTEIVLVARVTDTIGANLLLTNTASITGYDSQPGSGPQTGLAPTQRVYAASVQDSVEHQTRDAGIAKAERSGPSATPTLGSVVTYTLTVPDPIIDATLYDVVVTDTVDGQLTIEGVTPSGGTGVDRGYDPATGLVTATFGSIPEGTQATVSIRARITDGEGANAGTTIENSADMTHAAAKTVKQTSVVATDVGEPDLMLAKSLDAALGGTAGAGEVLTYHVTITNVGASAPSPAYDIVLTDTLPGGMRQTEPSIEAVTLDGAPVSDGLYTTGYDSGSGVFIVTFEPTLAFSVPVGSELTVVYAARLDQDVGAELSLNNAVEVTWSSLPGDTAGDRDYEPVSDHTTVDTPVPSIAKEVMPADATLGERITYTIRVPGAPIAATLYGVTVTDELDGRLELGDVSVDGAPSGVTVAGNVLTVTYDSIAALAQRRITVSAVVSSPLGAGAGDVITNAVVLEHRDGGPVASNKPSFIVTEPSLTLAKSSDPTQYTVVGAGQTVTYCVAVNNASGPTVSKAYDVVVTDTLPSWMRDAAPVVEGLTLDGAEVAPSVYDTGYDAPTGEWVVTLDPAFDVPANAELMISYTTHISSEAPADANLTNEAEVTWSSRLGDVGGERHYAPQTDSTQLNTGFPSLSIDKSSGLSSVRAGGTLSYAITNDGFVNASGVIVTDTLPQYTDYRGCGPEPCEFSSATGIISWTVGDVPLGEPLAVTASVRVTDVLPAGVDVITNTGWVTSSEGISDTDTVSTPVEAAPDLVIAKDDGEHYVAPGQRLTYTLTVTNEGTQDATGVVVTDSLPCSTTYVVGSATGGGQYVAMTDEITWSIGHLAVGTPVSLRFAVEADEVLTGMSAITNTAFVADDGENGPDEAPGDNTARDVDEVYGSLGDYVWTDLDGDGIQDPGEPGHSGVTVTLHVMNDGTEIQTITGPNGQYRFRNLVPGSYYLEFTAPKDYAFTDPHRGADDADSDAGLSTGRTTQTTLDPGENDLTWDAGLVGVADLGITVDSKPDPYTPGGPLTYTLLVDNGGPLAARETIVTDTLDPNTSYVSSTVGTLFDRDGKERGCTCVSQTVTCDLFALDVGERVTITIVTTVTEGFQGMLYNEAAVGGATSDPAVENGVASNRNTRGAVVGGATLVPNGVGLLTRWLAWAAVILLVVGVCWAACRWQWRK